jgi:hypothetical protein
MALIALVSTNKVFFHTKEWLKLKIMDFLSNASRDDCSSYHPKVSCIYITQICLTSGVISDKVMKTVCCLLAVVWWRGMNGTRYVWVPKHQSGAPLPHLGNSCVVTSHSRCCHLKKTSMCCESFTWFLITKVHECLWLVPREFLVSSFGEIVCWELPLRY